MHKLDERVGELLKENSGDLKHYGVMGMKWGVRRDRSRPGGADGIVETKKKTTKEGRVVPKKSTSKASAPKPKPKGKIARKLESMKRERQWKKVLNDMDKLNTKDINTVAKRVRSENDLKRLSKSRVGSSKDKDDYLRRDKMSDSELNRKVTRLRAKDSLSKAVRDASKEQREFGEKVADMTKAVTLKYATKKVTGKPIQAGDLFDVISKPKESAKNSTADLQKTILKKIEEKTNQNKS